MLKTPFNLFLKNSQEILIEVHYINLKMWN